MKPGRVERAWPTGSWDLEAAANLNSGRPEDCAFAVMRGQNRNEGLIGFFLFAAWESLLTSELCFFLCPVCILVPALCALRAPGGTD